MKKCSKCKVEKDESEFSKSKSKKSGLDYRCKECCKTRCKEWRKKNPLYGKDWYEKNPQYNKKYSKGWYRNSKNIERKKQHNEDWRKNNREYFRNWDKNHPKDPIAVKARHMVASAIENGTLIRQPCSVCKTNKFIHGHHEDYHKPLDVIWLCAKHHHYLHYPSVVS